MEDEFQSLLCRGDLRIPFAEHTPITDRRHNILIHCNTEGQRLIDEAILKWIEKNNSQLTKKCNMARQTKEIKVPEVLKMLETGHTRYKRDDQGLGNIQEKLGLTIAEVQEIFKHPKLANKKTKFPSRIKLIDDDEPVVVKTTPVEVPKEEKKEEPKEEPKKEDDVFS